MAKTTILNTLGAAVPGHDRIISVEEVFELRIGHPDWVPMQCRQAGLEGTGEVTLRHLVKESLRVRPSRIVVGEVRAADCLDLLLALNSGLPGMVTARGCRRCSKSASFGLHFGSGGARYSGSGSAKSDAAQIGGSADEPFGSASH
jgi:Flp pilus assembly CpaF family ATPase